MMAGRVGEEVVAAGRPGLEAAAAWGLETSPTSILRGNMSIALRLAGEVHRAAELIDPVPLGDHPTYEDAAVQSERANLDMLRGRCAEAVTRGTTPWRPCRCGPREPDRARRAGRADRPLVRPPAAPPSTDWSRC